MKFIYSISIPILLFIVINLSDNSDAKCICKPDNLKFYKNIPHKICPDCDYINTYSSGYDYVDINYKYLQLVSQRVYQNDIVIGGCLYVKNCKLRIKLNPYFDTKIKTWRQTLTNSYATYGLHHIDFHLSNIGMKQPLTKMIITTTPIVPRTITIPTTPTPPIIPTIQITHTTQTTTTATPATPTTTTTSIVINKSEIYIFKLSYSDNYVIKTSDNVKKFVNDNILNGHITDSFPVFQLTLLNNNINEINQCIQKALQLHFLQNVDEYRGNLEKITTILLRCNQFFQSIKNIFNSMHSFVRNRNFLQSYTTYNILLGIDKFNMTVYDNNHNIMKRKEISQFVCNKYLLPKQIQNIQSNIQSNVQSNIQSNVQSNIYIFKLLDKKNSYIIKNDTNVKEIINMQNVLPVDKFTILHNNANDVNKCINQEISMFINNSSNNNIYNVDIPRLKSKIDLCISFTQMNSLFIGGKNGYFNDYSSIIQYFNEFNIEIHSNENCNKHDIYCRYQNFKKIGYYNCKR